MWWRPEQFSAKEDNLHIRMNLIKAIRKWFDGQGFYEVETPVLQKSPGMEAHLRAFKTERISPELDNSSGLFLHTSPEFAMKKLLVAGLPKIYQICKCFRNAEGSSLHSCEFTMIEWYRANAGYRDIMDDCINLFRHCAEELGIDLLSFRGNTSNPFAEWEIISVTEAYEKYAGVKIDPASSEKEWEELFYKTFLNEIEPKLGQGAPTIIYDYPVSMAALARPKPEDPRFAERFEIYVCGMELANAFGELTDAGIQKERFEHDLKLKKELYGEEWPVDEGFISALEYGMPESGGIALGIDRLAMLFCGAGSIEEVMWCEII
jgi:lysyl-tRNA synthetase class 2